MKEEIKRLVEEAEIYEDVEVLGQAQSDAVCMVKKLRAAIRETDAEREKERAAWFAVVFGAMGYAADLSEVQRTNGGRLRMDESKNSFKKRIENLAALGVNVESLKRCV